MTDIDSKLMAEAMNKKNSLKKSDIKEVEFLLQKTLEEIQELKKLLKSEKKTVKKEK